MSTSQPVASTSSAADAFDAVVQAANPSHPNHAAWVERYGGSISRKGDRKIGGQEGEKDGDEESDHLEKSSQSSQRRRRSSSNYYTTKNGTHVPRSSPARERASSEANGKVPSRESSIRTSHQGARSSLLINATKTSLPEESAQKGRKKKKRRDKGKEKGQLPPIPPPRSTSQIPPSISPSPTTQYLYSGHASSSTLSTMHATTPSNRQTPSSVGSPLTPSNSLPLTHSSSINSCNNSISNQGEYSANLRDFKIPSKSPRRSKHQMNSNDPPIRLSSIVSRDVTEDDKWSNTDLPPHKPDFSPTQSYSSHTISRKNSRKSVDFALPEESQRRGNFDKYGLRKSFDTLVSPFRDASKYGPLSRNGYSPNSKDQVKFSTVPILKSPFRESSHVNDLKDQILPAGQSTRPLSSVQDEEAELEIIDAPIEQEIAANSADQVKSQPTLTTTSIASPKLDSTEVPTHPLALITSPTARSESMTEEGDDFFDAESDEGGNGSSADDRTTPKKTASPAISQNGNFTPKGKKRIKRKTSERLDVSKSKAKSNPSGLGVVGVPIAADQAIFSKVESKVDEVESSASDIERKEMDLLNEDSKATEREVKDTTQLQIRNRNDKGNTVHNESLASPEKTTSPSSDLPIIPLSQKTAEISTSDAKVQERKSAPSRKEATKAFPSQIVNTLNHDLIFSHDDENDRTYPFETSPSSYYFPSGNSSQSINDWNRLKTISPKSNEQNANVLLMTPNSIAAAKEKIEREQNQIKSVGKSGKGTFAGVMARMRRDKSSNGTSTVEKNSQSLDASLAGIESPHLKGKKSFMDMSPLGYGMATSTPVADIDHAPHPQSKGWRTRLISFSQKGAKSPKNNSEEWKGEGNEMPPVPPLPSTPLVNYGKSNKDLQADCNDATITQSEHLLDDSLNSPFANKSKAIPLQNEKRKMKDLKIRAHDESPTIHKTLSPALLTERNYEADEVASFIGSERDRDSGSKRATWTTLNQFEFPPDQILDREIQDSAFTSKSISKEDLTEVEAASPVSLNARRFPNADGTNIKGHIHRVSDFKSTPTSLQMPPPIPSLPKDDSSTVLDSRTANSSPISSRRSMDIVKMYRSGSNPLTKFDAISSSNGTVEGHHRGFSFALNRDQQSSESHKSSSKVPFSPSSMGSSKIGKRLFSGGMVNKNKMKPQGISSDNFHLSQGFSSSSSDRLGKLPFSKSEICLVKNGRSNSNNNNNINFEGRQFTDDSSITPSHSQSHHPLEEDGDNRGYRSIPVTPKSYHLHDEEASTFDKMLRERAKDDAARLRQITAQARAQQSPN